MQRKLVVVLGILVILLAAALLIVLLRSQSAPAPVSARAPEVNAVEPYHREMGCIDQLLQNNELTANEVGPALASCQGGASANQSNGQ